MHFQQICNSSNWYEDLPHTAEWLYLSNTAIKSVSEENDVCGFDAKPSI